VLLLLVIGTVQARDFLQGTTCTVPADQHIVGTLFVFCQNLDMAGSVDGDLVGVALRGTVSGTVTGGVYLSGGQIDIRGQIGQNIHFAGLLLGLSAQALPPSVPGDPERPAQYQGGLFNLSLSTIIQPEVQLKGSITGIGYQMRVLGSVDHEINYWGSRLTVGGWVHGDINASVGNPESDASRIETLLLPLSFPVDLENPGLTIMEGARVDGKLIYTGPAAGEIKGTLKIPVTYLPPASTIPNLDQPGTLRAYAEGVLQEATTLFTIGLVMLLIAPLAASAHADFALAARRQFQRGHVGVHSVIPYCADDARAESAAGGGLATAHAKGCGSGSGGLAGACQRRRHGRVLLCGDLRGPHRHRSEHGDVSLGGGQPPR